MLENGMENLGTGMRHNFLQSFDWGKEGNCFDAFE